MYLLFPINSKQGYIIIIMGYQGVLIIRSQLLNCNLLSLKSFLPQLLQPHWTCVYGRPIFFYWVQCSWDNLKKNQRIGNTGYNVVDIQLSDKSILVWKQQATSSASDTCTTTINLRLTVTSFRLVTTIVFSCYLSTLLLIARWNLRIIKPV